MLMVWVEFANNLNHHREKTTKKIGPFCFWLVFHLLAGWTLTPRGEGGANLCVGQSRRRGLTAGVWSWMGDAGVRLGNDPSLLKLSGVLCETPGPKNLSICKIVCQLQTVPQPHDKAAAWAY